MDQEQEQEPAQVDPDNSDKVPPEQLLAEADRLVQLFRSLVKSPAWDALVKIMQPQLKEYLGKATQSLGGGLGYDIVQTQEGNHVIPIDGTTRMLRGEYDKGVRAGILLTLDMPRATSEYYTDVASELREHIENLNKEHENE